MARPRSIDYDQKRESIKINSTRLFSGRGYHATSMSQVAAASGISKGLLYHYYINKEELLYDILESHLKGLLIDVEAAIDGQLSAEDQLGTLIVAMLDNYDDKDREHLIQLQELPHLPAESQEKLRDIERQIVAPIHQIISKIMKGSDSQALFAMPGTMTLFAIVNWCFLWLRPDGKLSKKEYAQFVTKLFLGGIRSI